MIRTCPKCRAYYADEALAFCLADGWPLLTVASDSESWQEGVRVIQENSRTLRRQRRKIRLRRIVLSGVTTLIVAMVVSRSYVVETTPAATIPPVLQSLGVSRSPVLARLPGEWPPDFLLPPESPSPSPATETSTPASDTSGPTSDTSSPTTDSSSPTTDTTSPTTDTTAPTSTSDSAHTPSVVYKISGRVTNSGQPLAGVKIRLEGSKATVVTTDANGYYSFSDLRAGGSYTVTPVRDKMDFKPLHRSFDNLTHDGSADFNGNGKRDSEPPVKCDEGRERQSIIDAYSGQWRKSVERERQKVIAENTRDGERAEATLIPHEPLILFVKECKGAAVTYKYTWQIKIADARGLRDRNVSGQRTVPCGKVFGKWICS